MLVALKVGNRVKAVREIMFVFTVCSMVSVRRKTRGMHGTSEVDTECGGIRIFYVMSANFMSSTLRHTKVGKPLCCVCVCESARE